MEYFNISPRPRQEPQAVAVFILSLLTSKDQIVSLCNGEPSKWLRLNCIQPYRVPLAGSLDTSTTPSRCFYGLLLCLQFWKLRPRVRCRNINGRLIWHKISPFGPGLCRTSTFLADNKNYSLSPMSPLPPPQVRVTSIEVTEVGITGSWIVIISVTPTKREGDTWLGHMVPCPYIGLVSFEFHQKLPWHKLYGSFMCQWNNGSEKMWFEYFFDWMHFAWMFVIKCMHIKISYSSC